MRKENINKREKGNKEKLVTAVLKLSFDAVASLHNNIITAAIYSAYRQSSNPCVARFTIPPHWRPIITQPGAEIANLCMLHPVLGNEAVVRVWAPKEET